MFGEEVGEEVLKRTPEHLPFADLNLERCTKRVHEGRPDLRCYKFRELSRTK